MAISLIDNLKIQNKKQNVERDSFATITDMVSYSPNYLPNIFHAMCEETGKMYVYNVNNDEDETLGKWRVLEGSGGGTADVPIEKIKVNGELQTPVNKVVDITVPDVTNDLTDELKSSYDDAVTAKHTHENGTVLDGITAEKVESWDKAEENVQSDWNETDDTADGFIKNKPTIPDITGLATETYVDNKVADYTKTVDLADVATSGSYNDLADKPTIPSLDGYAKTSEIPTKVSDLENDSNYLSSIPEEYVTETELGAKGYLTEHQDLSAYATKDEIPTVPSKVSELTNDSNYQTAEQVNSAVTTEIAKVVADAPEDLNTLKEMSDWIAGHENDASAMNSAISDNKTAITALQTGKADKSEIPTTVAELSDNGDYAKTADVNDSISTLQTDKANASDLTAHTDDADIHVTADDKTLWNTVDDKVDKTSILTNLDSSTTDEQVYSAKAINTELDKVVKKTDIVDNLTSTDTDKPLSANQGKILNDTKLNKTDANKLNCVTIDNVSLKEYILTNFTGTDKTYYLIAKTTCTDLPKASNFYITVEMPGLYTYKVTAKELNDSNGIYVCTYRTISSSWTAWEKVLITGDITTTISDSSTDTQVPSAKAVNELNLRGTQINQSVIDKYGTEILKYPFGRWYIDGNEIAGKFSDMPWATACIIDITSPIISTRNPWDNTWAYRNYRVQTIENKGTFVRQLESRGTPGVLKDTGWQKVCTTSVADVPNTVIVSKDTKVKLNSNCYYTVINGVCYVTLWGFTCTEAGQYVVNSSMPKTRLTMNGLCTHGSNGYEGGCAYIYYDGNDNNKLYVEAKTANEPLYGSFSYPVAES